MPAPLLIIPIAIAAGIGLAIVLASESAAASAGKKALPPPKPGPSPFEPSPQVAEGFEDSPPGIFPQLRAHWRVLFLDVFDVFVGELAIEQLDPDVQKIAGSLGFKDDLVFETQLEAETREQAINLIESNARAAVIGLDFGGSPLEGGPPPGMFDTLPPDAFPPVPMDPTDTSDPFVGPLPPSLLQKVKQAATPVPVSLAPLLAHPWIRLQATPGISGALQATTIDEEPEPEPDPDVISPGDLRHGDACGRDDFFMDYVGAMFNGMTCETDEEWHRVNIGGPAPDWADGEMTIAQDGRTAVAWDGKWWHKKTGEPCPVPNLRTDPTRFYGQRPGATGATAGYFYYVDLHRKVCRKEKAGGGASLGSYTWGSVVKCKTQKRRCVFRPFPFNVWDCYMSNPPRCS